MILVLADEESGRPPFPWPLLLADASGRAVACVSYRTALDAWMGSVSWLRTPDVEGVVLALGAGDAVVTPPAAFVAAVAACAFNARARWPDARIVVASPARTGAARARRWVGRVAPSLAERVAADGHTFAPLHEHDAPDRPWLAARVSAAYQLAAAR